ncbi:DNA-directed RNA polymerase alpha subunit [Roseateles asaccharophilus]|uniref:hypothetical protein n=1 Tax=Roseateles asaccharophilus TaxID=582607 RepID=UPI00383434A8
MPKLHAPKVIRTVADLAALSDVELQQCLLGLCAAIQARRRAHANAVAAGGLPADAQLDFDEYVWKPAEKRRNDWDQDFERTTAIADLPIRRRAVHQLIELRILAVEDLSAISERELLAVKDMASTTVTRLRELLHSLGLDFAEHPDPATAEYARNAALRRLPEEQLRASRAGLTDDAPVSRLGLRNSTLERTKRAGLQTLGELREASLRDLTVRLGRQELREVVVALQETGAGLRCNPTPLELWRAGVLELGDLEQPADESASVLDLQPWVGAVAESLHAAGIRTLGELRSAAAAGQLRTLRGVGAHSEDRLLQFLGLRASTPGGRAPAPGVPPATSVFTLGSSSGES